jgi:integrase
VSSNTGSLKALSPQLLQLLRAYWRLARPGHWLFPGRETGEPASVATLQEASRAAARQAELSKPVTVHTFGRSISDAKRHVRVCVADSKGSVDEPIPFDNAKPSVG